MSYSSFFHDTHPLFRLVEDPRSSYGSSPRRSNQPHQREAHAEVSEREQAYVVRVELPGVQKKDLDVHVSNEGRALNLEGRVYRTDQLAEQQAADNSKTAEQPKEGESNGAQNWSYSFTRSLVFPKAVDGNKAEAAMKDGVLTLTLPKRVDSGRQKINIL